MVCTYRHVDDKNIKIVINSYGTPHLLACPLWYLILDSIINKFNLLQVPFVKYCCWLIKLNALTQFYLLTGYKVKDNITIIMAGGTSFGRLVHEIIQNIYLLQLIDWVGNFCEIGCDLKRCFSSNVQCNMRCEMCDLGCWNLKILVKDGKT